jgi:hypothetical protein
MDNKKSFKLFIIGFLLVTAIILCCNKNEINEGFVNVTLPANWQQIAETQCKFLTDEITKIDKLIDECKNTPDNSKLAINSKITCRDANEMKINSSREQHHWCDSAKNNQSVDNELMPACGKSDNIDIHDLNLSFAKNQNINLEFVKKLNENKESENEKYNNFNSSNVDGYCKSCDNNFSSIEQ